MSTTPAQVVVRVAIAPLFAEPRLSSAQITQALAGHPLGVREMRGDWLLVAGRDEYEGWVHRGYVAPAVLPIDPPARLSLGCVVAADSRRALPLGAWISDDEVVESGEAVRRTELAQRFPRDGAAIGRTASSYFAGTSYQWGGITPWGADCSGMVQTVFGLHGIALPRDAWQQAECGRGAGALERLAAGDLPFFSDRADGRITHVGIALGGLRMVHLGVGRGGYAVESLDDTSDAYVTALRERFRFARRVI